MFDPGRGAVRHLRAMTAALACVTTALTAHAVSGGHTSAVVVVATFALSGALAWALAGARLTRSQILGLLVLCQVGVHLASMTSATDHAMGPGMVLAHVVGTAASAALLARGEAFVWAVAQHLVIRPVNRWRRIVLPAWRRLLVRAVARLRAARPVLALAPVRGPPTEPASVAPSL